MKASIALVIVFAFHNFDLSTGKKEGSLKNVGQVHSKLWLFFFEKVSCYTGVMLNLMLQDLPYFWNTKIHVVFFVFHVVQLYFFL